MYSERIVLPLWRSLHSLNLMLPKDDRKAMLLRLYNDDSPLIDTSKDRFRKSPEDQSGNSGEEDAADEEKNADSGTLVLSEDEEEGGVQLTEGEVVGDLIDQN